jgi:PKD repeat protein
LSFAAAGGGGVWGEGRGTIDEATARALYNLGYPKRGQAPSTLYRRWPLTSDANASGGAGPNFTLTGEPTYADDSAFFSAIDGFTPAAISRSAPAIVLENDLESATSHRQAVTVSSSGWGLVSFVHNNADPDSAGATVTVQAAGARNRAFPASASVYANRLSEYVENAADLFTFPFAGTFMTQVSVDAPAELKGVAVRFEPDYGVIPLYGHSFHCDPTRIVHLGDTWQVHTGMDTRGAVSITKNGTVLFTDNSAAMARAGDDVYHMGSVLAPMPAGVAVFITEHNGELKVAYIADDGSTTSLVWADVVSSGGDATYARVVADDAGTAYVVTRGTRDGSNGSGCAVYHVSDIPTGTPTVVYDQLGHDGFRQYPTHIELTDGLLAMAWTGAWRYGFAAVYDVSADKWYDLSKTQRGGNSKGDDTTPRFDATEWTTTQAAGTGLRIYGGSNSTYLATAIFDLTDWTNTDGAAAFLFSEWAGSMNEYAATTMRWVIQDGANTYVSGTDFDQPADWTCNSWRVFAKALWKDDDPTTGIAYLVMIDHDDRKAGGNYDTALPTGYTPYYDQGGRRIRAYKITNPTDYTAITFTLVETVSVTGSDDLTAGFVRSVPGSANTFTWQEAVNELTEFKRQTDDVLYEFPSGGATVADFTITGAVSDGPYLVGEEILFDGNATTFDVGVTPDFANRRGFTWDFGDGITSGLDDGGISMVHVYTAPGTYTVTLAVLDSDGGTDTVSKTVTIIGTTPKLPPRAESTATMLDMAFNESLADDSANSYTIAWVDDGSATAEYSDCIKSNTKCLSTANGYVQIDDADTLEGYTAGFTLSVWFKRSAANAEGALVWKDDVFELYVFESGKQHPLRCQVFTTTGNTFLTNWLFTGDDAWHNATVVYDAAAETAKLYTDGVLRQAAAGEASRTLSGTLAANANNLLIGHDGATRRWAGLIENVKIFNRPLSADEVSKTFTAERANFNSRIAQYIDYNVPSDLTEDVTNVLTVTLTADGFSETLATRTALSSTERVLLDHSKLAAGTYTLTAVVKNAAGTELDRFEETFIKGYDGIPRVGINEHNAICLNGVPFFPVTSFAINNADVSDWMHYATYPLVNLFYAQGNWPTDYDPNGWEAYLDLVVAEGSMAMGPSQWDGLNPYSTLYGSRYADTGTLVDYITQNAEHPGTFGWIWKDEPDLGGPSQAVPPATVASWSFLKPQV